MVDRPGVLLKFPDNFPKVSAGVFLRDNMALITGHKNGMVALWIIGQRKPKILLRASSEVYSIKETMEGDILIGCHAGDLYRLSEPGYSQVEKIIPATNSVYNRVFRVDQPLKSHILFTSTYGTVNILHRNKGRWEFDKLTGHKDSVFAVAHFDNRWIVTGDYRGKIQVWEFVNGEFNLRQRLVIDSYVSDICFIGDSTFAAIGLSGHVYLFEYEAGSGTWNSTFDTNIASGSGVSIRPSVDNQAVFAATEKEILQIDLASQQISLLDVKDTITFSPQPYHLLTLSPMGIYSVSISDFRPYADIVEYAYFKVGLLGNTSYGKTTLCSAITTGESGNVYSTFGRKTWTWIVESGKSKKRVMLNDNGGQEQVIGTLLPLNADSDAVLYFFKQTELSGFKTALDLHRQMSRLVMSHTKSYLVETYTDHTLKAVTDEYIREQIKTEGFTDWFKVTPLDASQVASFKEKFLRQLDWTKARRAIQSSSAEKLSKLIESLKTQGITVTSVGDIKQQFESVTQNPIYSYHLKFLLRNLADTGQLEYYPKIGDIVVLNDPKFNELRTNIPILAAEHGGIVWWGQIEDKFSRNSIFVKMLDLFYTSSGISIPFGDKNGRLFPSFLEERQLNVSTPYKRFFKNVGTLDELTFETHNIQLDSLLAALIDMELDCIDVSKSEGLFAWGTKAILYYHIVSSNSLLGGSKLVFSYKIDGTDAEAMASLQSQFRKMLVALFGKIKELPAEKLK